MFLGVNLLEKLFGIIKKKGARNRLGLFDRVGWARVVKRRFSFHSFLPSYIRNGTVLSGCMIVDKRFGRAAAIKITGGGVRHNFIKIFVVCTSFVVALRTVGNKTWRLAGWKTPPFRSIYDENLRYMHIAYARTYARDMNTRVHRPVKTYLRFHLSTRI